MNIRAILASAILCVVAGCGDARESAPAAAPAQPPAAEPAAEPHATPPGPSRDRVREFCIANYQQMMECVDDTSFRNIMGTLYVSTDPELAAAPEAKQRWIDMMKDVAKTLANEGELEKNCDAAIDHNKWPTDEQNERVEDARALSCADFGNAFGYMMFGEGVFFETTR